MSDEAKPKRGRPRKGVALTPDELQEVTRKVAARLRHMLEREARVGSGAPHRINPDDEAAGVKPSRILDEEMQGRLLRLLDDTEADLGALDAAMESIAKRLDPGSKEALVQLLPGEIIAVYDGSEEIGLTQAEVAELAAHVWAVEHHTRARVSELKQLLTGHYGIAPKRGPNPKRRSQEVAAHLLGYARGASGLPYVGVRESQGAGAIVEVIAAAWRDVVKPHDPAAAAIYQAIPNTQNGIEKLSAACDWDARLDTLRHQGFQLGLRERQAPEK
ncbi:hypothetical protein RAZWK3B_03190 [Roseobacter sp. AzwK-3b]|uniref:hypothetical protein n=1 Tax=Roseobacter sp. AzwK-3b TaxID=351016 RepID=UPI0001568E26|nr:hypothetical protein [Roseobacter sp. AzwK-3b]EDM73192.1 hypothetical protein RAZWK3B_03190 [Roseobacter sp. AzwK-3b]